MRVKAKVREKGSCIWHCENVEFFLNIINRWNFVGILKKMQQKVGQIVGMSLKFSWSTLNPTK